MIPLKANTLGLFAVKTYGHLEMAKLKRFCKLSDICFTLVNQKQPSTNVLQNRCSQKFPYIHWKTSMLKPLFNKVAGQACNFIKKRLQRKCFLCILETPKFLRIAFFIEHLPSLITLFFFYKYKAYLSILELRCLKK